MCILQIFDKDGKDKASLDINDESTCSWMMFVRAASSFDEQNLVAYQFNEDVYFATCKVSIKYKAFSNSSDFHYFGDSWSPNKVNG